MCFSTNINAKPKVAKKDMIVWKKGYYRDLHAPEAEFFRSGIRGYWYKLGVPAPKVELVKVQSPYPSQCGIHEGYHSCYDRSCRAYSGYVGKFMIPKGATYYSNPVWRERVSDTIIFLGWEDREDREEREGRVIYA